MHVYLLMIVSFILGFSLEIIAQQGLWLWLQPEWILLLIVYWLIYHPGYFSIFSCFTAGLAADIIYGTLLGKHALIYVGIALLIISLHKRIQLYTLGKMAVAMFFLTLAFLLFNFLSMHSMRFILHREILMFFTKACTTSLIWILAIQCIKTRQSIILHD